jgi:hypothetical protein
VGTDQAVKDLPQRQRQVLGVLVEHSLHLVEQRAGLVAWTPIGEAASARPAPLGTAEYFPVNSHDTAKWESRLVVSDAFTSPRIG